MDGTGCPISIGRTGKYRCLVAFAVAFFLSHWGAVTARADSLPCAAVDTLAEIYFPSNGLIAVDVAGDERGKKCYFSINGSTKSTEVSNFSLDQLQAAVDQVTKLKAHYRQKAPEDVLAGDAEILADFMPYLISAARLDGGEPPEMVVAAMKNYRSNVVGCLFNFYRGIPVNMEVGEFFCESEKEAANGLLLALEFVDSFYRLYVFR